MIGLYEQIIRRAWINSYRLIKYDLLPAILCDRDFRAGQFALRILDIRTQAGIQRIISCRVRIDGDRFDRLISRDERNSAAILRWYYVKISD